MEIEKDFDKFPPIEYLKEYYSDIGEENSAILKFLHNTYKNLEPANSLLEFGGGPTIYQLISASSKVNEIIFSEYSGANREEVKKWLNNNPGSFNWDSWFEFVLELENTETGENNLLKIKDRVKEKVKEVIKCDAYKGNPLEPKKYPGFDILSVCFVPESATDNENDYISFMKNIASLLRTRGTLVMMALKDAEYYQAGSLKFPAFPINENYLKNLLASMGFGRIKTETIPAEHDQGYKGIICLTATK